ncbi:MAG TPA: transglutaminase family protein [Bacteroidales bacterium]|jgi:transglutaminase-like putative cysteine protease|nr:transglutaminase [Bacteroidota bacterium]HJN06880.1 transglutaminase family protein [Bacteroidales bacterium]|tara:strand:+ start:109 stop:744 length:636 start_codon:yes stop_codon:yes gene_type:complete
MNYLSSTYYFDFENEAIQDIIREFKTDNLTTKEKAILLYLKIRDGWRYNPYYISFSKENYRASTISKKPDGHCIEKSILLIACLRGLNIPARIHFAKVKNHIGVERIVEKFGTNEMTPHGMVNVLLEGKWLKISPAFNKELCLKCNVAPLDFDGENDSIFHEFDNAGGLFMEYLEDYGHFEDVPTEFIFNTFKKNYPKIIELSKGLTEIRI